MKSVEALLSAGNYIVVAGPVGTVVEQLDVLNSKRTRMLLKSKIFGFKMSFHNINRFYNSVVIIL